jgi:hypothetical protein
MDEQTRVRLKSQVDALQSKQNWNDQDLARAQGILAEAQTLKKTEDRKAMSRALAALGNAGDVADPRRQRVGTDGGGLWGAVIDQGFDVKQNPAVIVSAAEALGVKAATFDGTIGEDTIGQIVQSPALGADSRFLYTRFPLVAVEGDVANVTSFRQKTRTLADPDDMVRAIDAVTDKPETDTTAEVVPLPLKQVANVSDGIPLILFASDTFRQWIQNDVELAWRYSIDKRVVDKILAATTAVLDGSPDNVFEEVLYARATVAAAGYRPNVVVVSPNDALAIELLQMTGGDSYAFSQDAPAMVVTPSVADGAGFVADASATGTLYSSPTRFETFIADPRKNTYIARYESNSEFQVHRPDAICMLGGTS